MAKRNYSQYSNKHKNESPVEESVVEETVNIDETASEPEIIVENTAPEIKVVEETVETVALPEIVVGVVVDCTKLNVRAKAKVTAEVVCVLDAASEVKIDVAKSTKDWFKVCTASGVEGYCMRKFVKASL